MRSWRALPNEAMNTTNSTALDYLNRLVEEEFYGLVALKFEHGKIVHVRQEQNLKPSELSGTPRSKYGNSNN
jgi:hypothetical protein